MRLDHLVYAGRDLEEAVHQVTMALGVGAVPGGQHLGRGTRNYLVNLDGGSYLEIIGPDPDQPPPSQPRPFGVDALAQPRLVAWAARTTDIDSAVASARRNGVNLGAPRDMQRATPDGAVLRWRLTPPRVGLIPFLIDWGGTAHPTESMPAAARLLDLTLESTQPARVSAAMEALELDVGVRRGPADRLAAEIAVDGSRFALR